MAINGTFDSRATVTIDADARPFLRAQATIAREQERAAQKQEAAIARELAATGQLTKAAFDAAKATSTISLGFDDGAKKVGLLNQKLKALGSSMLSGFGVGIVGGVLGGSVSSIIGKLFEPPDPGKMEELAKQLGDQVTYVSILASEYKKEREEKERIAFIDAKLALAAKDEAEGQALVDKYSGATASAARAQAYQYLTEARSANILTEVQYKRAILDTDAAYRQATGSAAFYNAAIAGAKGGAAAAGARGRGGGNNRLYAGRDWTETRGFDAAYADQAAREEAGRQQLGIDLGGGSDDDQFLADLRTAREELERIQGGVDETVSANAGMSPLERLFGPVDEFNAYADLFTGLTDAVGASYEAIVTGSEGAGAAFRKFAAGSLLALGKKAAVEAIYEVALAIKEPFDAGRHLLAAAKLGAVAVAAGVAASALGGGGGTGASATGGGGGYAGGDQGGGGDGGHTTVFVYGDSFADDSPRMRALKAEKLLKLAGQNR